MKTVCNTTFGFQNVKENCAYEEFSITIFFISCENFKDLPKMKQIPNVLYFSTEQMKVYHPIIDCNNIFPSPEFKFCQQNLANTFLIQRSGMP